MHSALPKFILALTGCLGLIASTQAANLEIKIINTTKGITYTPFFVAGHADNFRVFEVGQDASADLQAMAEGGDISGLQTLASAANAVVVANPNNGNLAPGTATPAFTIDTGNNKYLSIVAMLLPTNDAFAGLDSWKIPTTAGTYTINLNAYDAGTEANNEIVNGGGTPNTLGIPAAPQGDNGTNGTGITDNSTNDKIHIHPGSIGDFNATGGPSDLDATIHRWLNPVVRVSVTVR